MHKLLEVYLYIGEAEAPACSRCLLLPLSFLFLFPSPLPGAFQDGPSEPERQDQPLMIQVVLQIPPPPIP